MWNVSMNIIHADRFKLLMKRIVIINSNFVLIWNLDHQVIGTTKLDTGESMINQGHPLSKIACLLRKVFLSKG